MTSQGVFDTSMVSFQVSFANFMLYPHMLAFLQVTPVPDLDHLLNPSKELL